MNPKTKTLPAYHREPGLISLSPIKMKVSSTMHLLQPSFRCNVVKAAQPITNTARAGASVERDLEKSLVNECILKLWKSIAKKCNDDQGALVLREKGQK